MVYGYILLDSYIQCNIDTDFQDIATTDVKKVRLFLNQSERDAAAKEERKNNKFCIDTEMFNTKSNQGKLRIISNKEYNNMVNEINRLKEELSKYKK